MTKQTDFNIEKAVQAVNFFLTLEPSKTVSKMKLLKLLWLADRYTIRNYGYSLTGDQYFAMQHGPVGSSTKDVLDGKVSDDYINQYVEVVSNKDIASKKSPDFQEFSETDISTLRTIHSVYGKMSPFQLRDFSHKFPEWLRWQNEIETIGGRYKISADDFFENPSGRIVRTIFTEDDEKLKINKEIYKEELELHSLLG